MPGDGRAKLTWRDRFAPQPATAYYDFHSTGEEVLGYDADHVEDTPSLGGVLASELKSFLHITLPGEKGQPNGFQSWIYQEQLKGRTITGKVLGSNYGGWGFNTFHFKNRTGGYAKRVEAEIPVSGVEVGYDLAIGDWVAPYGKGKNTDMVFYSEGMVNSDRDYHGQLTIRFPNQGNGLMPREAPQPEFSPLRMPYEGPADGYQPMRIWRSVRRYNPQTMANEEYINDSSKTMDFFIRVRCELNAEGKVMRAWYGKIHAPFIPRGFNTPELAPAWMKRSHERERVVVCPLAHARGYWPSRK